MSAHIERHYSLYTIEQLFDLVADVENYPRFLPWILSSRIIKREQDAVWVEMLLGIGPLHQHFHSHALLHRPDSIEVNSEDAPFKWYRQQWRFAIDDEGRTVVEYRCDFSIRSRFLELISTPLLDEAARATVAAFERRARQVYGVPTEPVMTQGTIASAARCARAEHS